MFLASLWSVLLSVIYLALIGLSIYCIVLFIKLAHRAIKALDIYINKNSDALQ